MEILYYLPYLVGLLVQVTAIVHFIRHRPDMYWIYLIIFLGPLGSIIYLVMVAAPDFISVRQTFIGASRRNRITEIEAAVRDNPSAANYEELGELYYQNWNFEQARAAFNNAIGASANSQDSLYRRALCAIQMNDSAAAIPDLERIVASDPGYDFNRASGLLAQANAQAGYTEKAETLFLKAIASSTLSETYMNYADLLARLGRHTEARQWAQKVLDKQLTVPRYLRRQERPWVQRASMMLKQMPA